jgi:hypothetical protein
MDGVPDDVLVRLRRICLTLPQVTEEQAWTGVRWTVRTRTFAHVLLVDHGWPPAYARVVGADGSAVVATFRTRDPTYFASADSGPRCHHLGFGRDTVGVTLDDATDWDELAEWLTESYLMLAPARLAALVATPPHVPRSRDRRA